MDDAALIIGGGIFPTYMAQEAQAMGLKALVVDGNSHAPGATVADAFYPVDAYDAEACAALIPHIQQTYTLRGVCTAGAEVAYTVSKVATAAGLPGIQPHVAAQTIDKLRVRDALKLADLGCYQPRYTLYDACIEDTDGFHIHERDNFTASVLYPLVVKPLRQRASRGISIVHIREALDDAIRKARQYGDMMLFEECLVGTEHSAEIIFGTDGTPCWWNIVDRLFDYSSGTGIELGHVNPTCLPAQTQQQILLMVLAAAKALEVNFGPFKIDVMLTAEGPKVLECTARLSGGFDSQRTSPLTGRHPMRQVLQLACGLPVEPQLVANGYAACAAILPQKHGRVEELPMIRTDDHEVIWCVKLGDVLGSVSHNGERPGFVICSGDEYGHTWKEAKHFADSLAKKIILASESAKPTELTWPNIPQQIPAEPNRAQLS